VNDLAATARWTAAARALETGRPDALFDDPWAAALAGEAGRRWAEVRPLAMLAPMLVRTRFFDDFLRRVTLGGVTQVILLGAGLDTRALRLSWPPDTTVFEVDQPDVIRYKEEVLRGSAASPRCARHLRISADLGEGSWRARLVEAGLDPGATSAWLAEGFLFYLPVDTISTLLDQVSGLAWRGSALGFDIPNHPLLTHPSTRSWLEMQAGAGAPWIGTMDDPAELLAGLGWEVTLSQLGASDADYERSPLPVIPITARELPHHWLVTARKLT
jgi:methyltransferase (TIGR00027 family)